MPRFYAFLRAINVGGHTVTMAKLREEFAALGLDDVETFIASGNVIFSTAGKTAARLEAAIEARLESSLGFEVKTFVRTGPELVKLAAHPAFPAAKIRAAGAYCIGFLAQPMTAAGKNALLGLKSAVDDFQVNGREVYWLCRVRQHESKFSNVVFEKATKIRITFRGANTVAKLAAKASSWVASV